MNEVERDRLVAWLVAEFEVQNGIDVTNDATAITRLREASERAAAAAEQYEVNLPYLAADETGPKHLHVVLTRKRIAGICAGVEGPPHVDRARRSAPPPPEPREERPRERESSTGLVFALALLFFGLVLALTFTFSRSTHSHGEHEGHGQEHKR